MDKYGLVGYPLGHSFSRDFFNEKFKNEGIDAEYVNFEIPSIERFPEIITENANLCGLNVTIPYKEKIIPYMNELSEEARHIGAVNVVRIGMRKGKPHLKGFNSDVIGFTRSIEPLLEPIHRKALILGTGGASKAVRYGLHRLGIETRFVSRNPKEDSLTYPQLTPEIMDEYKVIVNCTPVGCILIRKSVRHSLIRPSDATTCCTIWFTIRKKPSFSEKDGNKGLSPKTVWRC